MTAMADAAQIEADLLAALGASMPDPEPVVKPEPTDTDTSTLSSLPPSQPAVSDTLPATTTLLAAPVAAAAPTVSAPVSPAVSAQHPVSASVPNLSATVTETSVPPAAPATALVPPPASAPAPAAPVVPSGSQTLATFETNKSSIPQPPPTTQPSIPPRIDSPAQSLPQTVPPAPTPAPAPALASQPSGAVRSPKRPRSPNDVLGNSVKRPKIEPAEQKDEPMLDVPDLDVAAMLNDALANFDQQANNSNGAADVSMPDADKATKAPSATSEADKPENKIMKASSNPFFVMRSMSLPVLGNIAVQILLRLSQQSRAETDSLLSDAKSDFRKSYDMVAEAFRATRRIFSDTPLLSADELEISDSEDRETIRISNLAATAASAFVAHDVPLGDVHEAFFTIFIPEDGEYKDSLSDLLVCIKTRLFLDEASRAEQGQSQTNPLDTFFPLNFDETLKQRSGDVLLTPDEQQLVNKLKERRDLLTTISTDEVVKKSMEEQASMDKYINALSNFLQGHLAVVVDYAEKYGVNIPLNEDESLSGRNVDGAQWRDGSHASRTTPQLPQANGISTQAKDSRQPSTSGDDALDLKKLIEESLNSQLPELKEPPPPEQPVTTTTGVPDADKPLASFIQEKLKTEIEPQTHGITNMATPAHPASTTGRHLSFDVPCLPVAYSLQYHIPNTHLKPTKRPPLLTRLIPKLRQLPRILLSLAKRCFLPISLCPRRLCMKKLGRQPSPSRPTLRDARACTQPGGRGLLKRRKHLWRGLTWSRVLIGVRSCHSLGPMAPFQIF